MRHCIDWGKQEEEELEERGKLSLSQGSKTQEHSTIAGFVLSTRLGAMLLLSAAILFATLPAYANTKSHRHRSSHTKKSSSRARGGVPLYKAALLEDADSADIRQIFALADEANYSGDDLKAADFERWTQIVSRQLSEEKAS